jgi:hypothetical protein
MLQEVLEDSDLLQVSSARIFVIISGTIRDRDLKCSQVKKESSCLNGRVYSSVTAS